MMNKLFTLFYLLIFLLLYGSLKSQNNDQIHIQYLYVRSPIANVYEDLYSDGKKVISKQDGNIMWTDPNYNTNTKAQDLYFISDIEKGKKKRNFFFTNFVKDNSEDYYFVLDEVPAIDWIIENDYSKKILGYDCKKATGNFRGSAVTAYFTDKIPYPIGPAKFYGLPGAILDVRADGKNYDLWKAVKIDMSDKTDIDYNPQFPNFTKVKMQEFVNRKDNTNRKAMNNSTVSGSTGKVATVRLGLEKVYEWEK